MEPNKEKSELFRSVYTQIFIIVIAFIIMCVSSYIFVSSIERKHLVKDAGNMLTIMETELNAMFLEYETFLAGQSETIRKMILAGENLNTISMHIKAITDFMLNDMDHMRDLNNLHGYLYEFGGKYISGKEEEPDNEFIPEEHSWVVSAIEAGGKIVVTENE
jgi:hypothetical protein